MIYSLLYFLAKTQVPWDNQFTVMRTEKSSQASHLRSMNQQMLSIFLEQMISTVTQRLFPENVRYITDSAHYEIIDFLKSILYNTHLPTHKIIIGRRH